MLLKKNRIQIKIKFLPLFQYYFDWRIDKNGQKIVINRL